MTSRVKEKMRRGEVAIAVNLGGHNPDIAEHLARLGADLAFIDCERTGIGLDAATDLIRAARAAGLPCVVRSRSKAPEVLVRYACGDAAAGKFVAVQIETKAAVQAVDAMAAVPGVDVFLIGPNDLSYEMTGKRGARTPEVNQAIEHVAARLRHAGRSFGMPARLNEIAQFRARGAPLLYYPVEWLLERGLDELKRAIAG